MKSVFLILIFPLGFICCKQTTKSDSVQISKTDSTVSLIKPNFIHSDTTIKINETEDKLYNLIYNLPEVKERSEYVEKETNGERHLSIMIVETPEESDDKSYWLKVGEDNGTNVVTHFTFSVNPDTFDVKYYDAVNDTLVSLSAWRKGIPTE